MSFSVWKITVEGDDMPQVTQADGILKQILFDLMDKHGVTITAEYHNSDGEYVANKLEG